MRKDLFMKKLCILLTFLLAFATSAFASDTIDGLTAKEWHERATSSIDAENYENAISELTNAIKLNPKFSVTYHDRGSAYYEQSLLDEAIADFTKSIELTPNNSASYMQRGIIYIKKDLIDNAIADFSNTITSNLITLTPTTIEPFAMK